MAVAGPSFLWQGSCSRAPHPRAPIRPCHAGRSPQTRHLPLRIEASCQSLMLMRGNSSWRGGQLELQPLRPCQQYFFEKKCHSHFVCFLCASAVTAHSFWQSELVESNCGFNKSLFYKKKKKKSYPAPYYPLTFVVLMDNKTQDMSRHKNIIKLLPECNVLVPSPAHDLQTKYMFYLNCVHDIIICSLVLVA